MPPPEPGILVTRARWSTGWGEQAWAGGRGWLWLSWALSLCFVPKSKEVWSGTSFPLLNLTSEHGRKVEREDEKKAKGTSGVISHLGPPPGPDKATVVTR